MIFFQYATLFNLVVVPAVRMTQKGKFYRQNALRYIHFKKIFAQNIKKTMLPISEDMFPCKISFIVGYTKNDKRRLSGDWDNYAKSIQDGLVMAGIIPNDNIKYINGSNHIRIVKSKEPFVWVGFSKK